MGRSPHFARIQREVLQLVESIPRGRISTYGRIGTALDVMARHVAYILAMLPDEDADMVPWFRVVGDEGQLRTTKRRSATQQAIRLQAEGIEVANQTIVRFDELVYSFD